MILRWLTQIQNWLELVIMSFWNIFLRTTRLFPAPTEATASTLYFEFPRRQLCQAQPQHMLGVRSSFPQTRNVRDDLILVLHSESNIKISSIYSWCLALIAYLLLTDDIIEHLLLLLRKPQLDRWDLLRRCYALDWKIVKNNFRTTIFVICSVYYYSSRPWCWITIQASQCYAAFSRSRCEAFNDEWNHP